jgi:acyl-CoA thioester hydrolase
MKEVTVPPRLASYPIVVELPVQWGEMDAYGHVHNSTFFRYFETARVEYLTRCGFIESYDTERIGIILHSTDCRFRRPLYHPDNVLVGTRASEIGDDRFTMRYVVVSTASNDVVAEGNSVVVAFDYAAKRKTQLPEHILTRIRQLEQRANSAK